MSGSICPLYNEYGETLRWSFTEPLGTCIYNALDEIAFIVGWLSVASWTFALLPQIITNCKNKAAESQSFWFWLMWLIGDVCNFAGCILTRNLVTNIALALVYLSITAFACLQFIWYEYFLKRAKFTKQLLLHQLPNRSPSSSYESISRHSLPLSLDDWWGGTPNFARKYVVRCPKMSPVLRDTLKIVARSPRMFAVSTQLTAQIREEYNAVQAKKREKENHIFSSDEETFEETSSEDDDYDINLNVNDSTRRLQMNPVVHDNITPNPELNDENTVSSYTQSRKSSDDIQDTAPLAVGNNNPNYNTMSTIMSTLSSMTTTVVMLYGINNMQSNEYHPSGSQRVLLHHPYPANNSPDVAITIGMILGWTSSVIYISSRIPQLRLMVRTKAVSGINPLFFMLCFSGNVTQCLSMLINRQIYTNQKDLFSKLPWLASSGICIFQDGFILFLLWLYHEDRSSSMKNIQDKEACRSEAVMMTSPHYLIPKDPEECYYNKKKRKKKKRKKRNPKAYDKAYFDFKYGDEDPARIKKNDMKEVVILNTV